MTEEKKKELWRTIKFTLISLSAGIIELLVDTLLHDLFHVDSYLSYFIALIASVIWNFTFNRKYTFKSASNVGKAMLLVLAFYVVFTPASTLLKAVLCDGIFFSAEPVVAFLGWPNIIGTILCMVLNFVLEYLYQRFVVFKDSLDTNEIAKKEGK